MWLQSPLRISKTIYNNAKDANELYIYKKQDLRIPN